MAFTYSLTNNFVSAFYQYLIQYREGQFYDGFGNWVSVGGGGLPGPAASIQVGSVSYGLTLSIVNVGTSQSAIFNFTFVDPLSYGFLTASSLIPYLTIDAFGLSYSQLEQQIQFINNTFSNYETKQDFGLSFSYINSELTYLQTEINVIEATFSNYVRVSDLRWGFP